MYFTLTGYYHYCNREWNLGNTAVITLKLNRASQDLGYKVNALLDESYGAISSYHEEALKEVLGFEPQPSPDELEHVRVSPFKHLRLL